MKHIFIKSTILLIVFAVFSQSAPALPFDMAGYPITGQVSRNNITLKLTDLKQIENGDVIGIRIVIENNSTKALSTGVEDFSMGGVSANANAVGSFFVERDRNGRLINMIPYLNTLTSFVSTPQNDMLQDMVIDAYRGGLILPNASKSGYILFRKAKPKDFKMYAIYNSNLLILHVPVIEKVENIQQLKKSDESSGKLR